MEPGSDDVAVIDALELSGTEVSRDNQQIYSVSITDTNLLAAIRTELGIPTGDLSDSDLLNLIDLDVLGVAINDFSGLEYATNLSSLNLSDSTQLDLLTIGALTQITELNVSGATITNLSSLGELEQLTILDLSNTNTNDLSVLENLMALEVLNLSGNDLSGIHSLDPLTNKIALRDLDLSDSALSRISSLDGLVLDDLNIDNNRLDITNGTDDRVVIDAFELVGTNVSYANQVVYVVSIPDVSLKDAIRLALTKPSGGITDTDMLGLTSLTIDSAAVSSLTGLEYALNLVSLSANDNELQDISSLSDLDFIRTLSLSDNEITDVEVLLTLDELLTVNLDNNFLDTSVSSRDLVIMDQLIIDGVAVSSAGQSSVVDFSDPNLETGVREALGITTGLLSEADLLNLTSLTLNNASLTNLSGLELATNLLFLNLDNNDLSDVSALTELHKLISLSLNNNLLSDLSDLSGLMSLTTLSVNHNLLENIESALNIDQLQTLNVEYNYLDVQGNDKVIIDALRSDDFNLAVNVDVTGQEILDEIPDAELKATILARVGKAEGELLILDDLEELQFLDVSDSEIGDLTGLEFAVNLQILRLNNANINDLSPLEDLSELVILELANNDLTSLESLSNLSSLKSLNVSGNRLESLAAIKDLSLTSLDVNNNYLNIETGQDKKIIDSLIAAEASVSYTSQSVLLTFKDEAFADLLREALGFEGGADIVVSDLLALTEIDGSGLGIYDISGIEHATELVSLNLSDNDISDISHLRNLVKLEVLNLSENNIVNIAKLTYLIELRELYLSSNHVQLLGPLKTLVNLRILYLDENEINEIDALLRMKSVRELYLQGNYISDITPLSYLMERHNGGLDVINIDDNYLMVYDESPNADALKDLDEVYSVAGLDKEDYSDQPNITLIYKSKHKGVYIHDGLSDKVKLTSYIIMNFDFEGILNESYEIKHGKDLAGDLYKEQLDLDLEADLASGKNESDWRFYHDSNDEFFLSGKLKSRGRIGTDINGRGIEQVITPSLKGYYFSSDELDSRKTTWKLDGALTGEANSYNPKKINKSLLEDKKPSLEEVLNYIMDVKLSKNTEI